MRMIAIHAQTERKRLDRSVRCAEKRRPWARKQRLRGLIRPDPAVCATAGAACGRKSLSSARIQALFTSNDTPLGECRLNVTAFVTAFLGTVAMWWIYFDTGSERASARFAHVEDSGHVARLTYTYIHQIIVIGIVGCAVSDELILAHPDGHLSTAAAFAILGGPALYVLGCGLFKYPLLRRFPLSHLVGLGLLALLIPFSSLFSPLGLAAAGTGALLVVAGWEVVALRHITPRRAD
ncbi:membrane protein-like protein [Xanthobacter versatilis]|uniref:Membrane protein-like protein n=1 Tax=Xanthobacter autotrophicus (strain ATCC BAA-1158 / Py2) TaxID=78245 RepID=A7IGV0_XANP2|nr:membrane protein-like protein [Xanthobacter autotrophicus Py2]